MTVAGDREVAGASPTDCAADASAADRTLVAAFLTERDEHAFRRLYGRHSDRLYGLALRLLGGADRDAEDAVQETWFRAVRLLPAFRWDATLSTWLCAILIRCCRERWRDRDRPATDEINDVGPGADDVRLIALADRVDLTRAIAALPGGYRQVLVLHDIEGYTHDEIARLTGIETGASKSQLSRARRALRRQLTDGETRAGSTNG